MRPIVLDTCAMIWLSTDNKISASALDLLAEAAEFDGDIVISPISAWEIGMLVGKGRLKLPLAPLKWLSVFMERSGARLTDMPPSILIESNFLPGKPPTDPADRIIAATARDLGATLVTRDRLLLGYAEQGHLRAVAC